ncbi:dirigent protein [Streptomyces sp. NL15-2K]|uniref:dirigent protein n=1 Tax=Streptomyces sp. NL15-2K TaxID=376149 RepID=UPI00209BC955|nr:MULTISPECIES: dirigent protein [Actinomycetes]WKX06682.1 dirigent protein [Kutzneria buriramensis]
MRKFRLAAVVGGTVCVLAAVGLSAAQAEPQSTSRHGKAITFTVIEHADTDTVVDLGPRGDSIGDTLAFGNPVYDTAGSKVGDSQGSCVRTKVGTAWECSWTTTLSGGSIVVQGPFYDAADSTLAITGGTGKWRTARGQMYLHARDAKGSAYDFTFAVER